MACKKIVACLIFVKVPLPFPLFTPLILTGSYHEGISLSCFLGVIFPTFLDKVCAQIKLYVPEKFEV